MIRRMEKVSIYKFLGTLFYNNNTKYIGDWKDDKMHGHGLFYRNS